MSLMRMFPTRWLVLILVCILLTSPFAPIQHVAAADQNLVFAALRVLTDEYVDPVQPVALRYRDAASEFSPAVVWVGETSLVESVWKIAGSDSLQAEVALLPLQDSGRAERRALAAAVRTRIQAALDA